MRACPRTTSAQSLGGQDNGPQDQPPSRSHSASHAPHAHCEPLTYPVTLQCQGDTDALRAANSAPSSSSSFSPLLADPLPTGHPEACHPPTGHRRLGPAPRTEELLQIRVTGQREHPQQAAAVCSATASDQEGSSRTALPPPKHRAPGPELVPHCSAAGWSLSRPCFLTRKVLSAAARDSTRAAQPVWARAALAGGSLHVKGRLGLLRLQRHKGNKVLPNCAEQTLLVGSVLHAASASSTQSW